MKIDELKIKIEKNSKEFEENISLEDFNQQQLLEVKNNYLGKKSFVHQTLGEMKDFDPQDRKEVGQLIQSLKKKIEEKLEEISLKWQKIFEEKNLKKHFVDVTLPPDIGVLGSVHPITYIQRKVSDFLERKFGFEEYVGPEMEMDENNFQFLNFPPEHPARDMQDTFFLETGRLLRTHTTAFQAALLKDIPHTKELSIRKYCTGYVYRNENDMTHVPAFRQLDVLCVGEGIHMGHLKYMIQKIVEYIFGQGIKIRTRASFFPFTEPSAEYDMQCPQCKGAGCPSCKGTGWLEIMAGGVVHPTILTGEANGVAFALGLDRMAMLKFGYKDLRSLFQGDISKTQHLKLNL